MPSDVPPQIQYARLPLPQTVGMAGPDVDLIESGIASYERNDLTHARDEFRRALAIRSQTAVANFNLGVTELRLGNRAAGAQAMRLGFSLARDHGMGSSPQASAMQRIAAALDVMLD